MNNPEPIARRRTSGSHAGGKVRDNGPVIGLDETNTGNATSSTMGTIKPSVEDRVHSRADTITSVLYEILTRPDSMHHRGINE
jgi:hypothetical protein